AELAGVTWSELAPLVMARSEPEQAYLQLRLAPVLPDVPQTPAPRRGVSEANLWIATALEWPEGSAWRLFGWLGDLSSAELALRSQLEPPAAPGTEDQPSASAPGHWSARVAGADPELGVVARLRAASGKRSLSLELWRAHAAVPARRAWVEDEIVRALAWGRPWHALAILDALPEAPQGALTEAVDAVLAVAEAVCGKPCDDPQDLDVVVEVMGSAWVDAQAQRIRGRVDLHVDVPSTIGCDVASTMTRSILDKAWRAPGGAVSAQEIVTGLESELVWECAGQWLLPLLAATTEPPHHAVARFIDLV